MMKDKLNDLEKIIDDFFHFLKDKGYQQEGYTFSNLNSDPSQPQSLSDYPCIELVWVNIKLNKKISLKVHLTNKGQVPIFRFYNMTTGQKFADYDYYKFKYKIEDTYERITCGSDSEKLLKYFEKIKDELLSDLGKSLYTDYWEDIQIDWQPYK